MAPKHLNTWIWQQPGWPRFRLSRRSCGADARAAALRIAIEFFKLLA
jgi:hypothetical protein